VKDIHSLFPEKTEEPYRTPEDKKVLQYEMGEGEDRQTNKSRGLPDPIEDNAEVGKPEGHSAETARHPLPEAGFVFPGISVEKTDLISSHELFVLKEIDEHVLAAGKKRAI
jgi:hypothetical protein